MNYLVTGGCGFIGSHLVDLLVEQGQDVYVIDNISTGKISNLNAAAKLVELDLLDKKKVHSAVNEIKPRHVMHLAALPRIQPSFSDPVLHDNVNVRATINILEACRKIKLDSFVFSSSSAVYGTPDEYPTTESAQIQPLSPYALQKYTAERYVHILGEYWSIPVVSLRYFNVYGPRSFNPKNPFNAYSSVVGIFNSQSKNNETITITGDGSQKRDFIHVRDVASANYFVSQNISNTKNKVYNVGSGNTISILELAKLFGVNYDFIRERKGEAEITFANTEKLNNLGWNYKVDLIMAIKSGDV